MMIRKAGKAAASLWILALMMGWSSPVGKAEEWSKVPVDTHFMVELRSKLAARKVKQGKKFKARTVGVIRAEDGNVIKSRANIKGRISYVRGNQMMLTFEEIKTRRGKTPLVASVVGIVGGKGLRVKTGDEGQIKTSRSRARRAAIAAAVGAVAGAVVGGTKGGAKGAAIGAGTGAAGGALVGAISADKDLVLPKGTRLELVLDRPLLFKTKK